MMTATYQPTPADRAAYEYLGNAVADHYQESAPELAVIARDPRRFLESFRERVQARRARGEPLLELDFSEYGVPACRGLIRELDAERAVLEHDLATLRTQAFVRERARLRRELETGLVLIAELRAELVRRVESGITYRRLLQLAHSVSRAVGHFDHGKLTWLERAILTSDRMQQGYERTSIDEELRRFRSGEFPLFQRRTVVPAFERHRERFAAAYQAGEIVGLPTCAAIEEDILLRLLPYELYLGGVSSHVLGTDGYSRTSGDLSLHDVMHSTLIYGARREYEEMHDLDDRGREALRWAMERWGKDLLEAVLALGKSDPDDARAIRFYVFNHHHDQGNPLVPSSIQGAEMEPVGYLLYFKMVSTRQMEPLTHAKARFRRAHQFLCDFWSPRRAEERSLWGPRARHVPWATRGVERALATVVKSALIR